MSGDLTYRLTVVDPAGATFTPGDTSIGDDHFWVTSRRRADHPWIEQPPSGDGASVDPVTGRVSDAEYRVRVIDVPEETCVAWTAVEVANAAALGLNASYLSNGWAINGNANAYPFPNNWWGATVTSPTWSGSVLFAWWDNWPSLPLIGNAGPITRTSYIEKTVTGLTPGQTYGLTFSLSWTLDTGPGNVFVEIDGASGPSRVSVATTGNTIWTVTTLENDQTLRLRATADGAGTITIRMGGEGYRPSANVLVVFNDVTLQELTCTATGIGNGGRYVTLWLADAAARQQLLGRRAYIEQSLDDGASWAMLQAGYVTSLDMPDSLVFEFAVGDVRRVERTRAAWRDLAPTTEATFSQMTAVIGGPVYGGFEPYSPKYALPLFRVVDAQFASGNLGPGDIPDGWVRLNYISGPMPPGFRHPGTSHAASLTYRTLNERVQQFHDAEQTWSTQFPPGAFPGLRAALFDSTTGALAFDDMVPVGRNTTPATGLSATRQMVRALVLQRGQEFINRGLEIVLRHPFPSPVNISIGQYYYVLITPREVSDEFPLFVNEHPVDLELALLTRHDIPVDSASAATVKAALGSDLRAIMRYTDPAQTVQAVCDELHAAFGYATRINAAGEREFFVWRPLVDTAPSLAIVTAELRDQGGPTYELDEDSRRNRLVFRQDMFRTISFDDEDIIGAPSAVAVVESTQTYDYSTDGGATIDADVVGALEQTVALTGHVAWRGVSGATTLPAATTPMSQTQFGQGLARALFALTGRGVQEATIVTRRDAADADAADIGDPVDLDADHVPNAQLGQTPVSQRGGSRWWRVVKRTEEPEGALLTLADAGTGVAYGQTVSLIVRPDSYDPGFFWEVEIDNVTQLNTDGAWVELQVALGTTVPSGAGVRYTVLDALQMVDGGSAVVDPYTYRIGPFPHQAVVWVRARAFLVGGSPGAWSAWTSPGGPVGANALSNLVIYPVTTTTATLTWDNTDVVNSVRVQYRLNDTGAYTTFATLGATATTSTITGLALDSMYGVRVVLWDGVAEVGTPLTGQLRTLPGQLSSLVITQITASAALLQWGNTHPTFSVAVQFRVTGTTSYGLWLLLGAGSIQSRLFGLSASTSYDVRVVLVDGSGAEFGTALTGTFVTTGSLGTLGPPTNPAAFAGTDPASGGFSRGLYGLRVYADTTNPPHWIVIEEAVETAVGSATPGTYAEVDFLPAQFAGATLWSTTAPNDGKLRYLRAKSRALGYSDSATTAVVSIDPWDTQPPVDVPLTGTITLTQSLAEDATAEDAFLIQPGATVTKVECTSSHSSRLQLYDSASARTNDAGRSYVQLPQPGAGVLLDVVFPPGFYTITLNPVVPILDTSGDYNPTITVYYRLTSYEPGTNTVVHVITYVVPSTRGGA